MNITNNSSKLISNKQVIHGSSPGPTEETKESVPAPLAQKSFSTPDATKGVPNLLHHSSEQPSEVSPAPTIQHSISRFSQSDTTSQMSDLSTQSTRCQVSQCRGLIQTALGHKKEGNKRAYYECFKGQAILNGHSDQRQLRIWVKAFIELINPIMNEHQDQEMVDLLLFKLPWLCHGLKQSNQAQVTAGTSSNHSSCFSAALEPVSQQSVTLYEKEIFPFGPSVVHGQNFKLFKKLCFAVFPNQVTYVHRVIKHILSHLGIFSCEQTCCIGHWQHRNSSALVPPSILDVFNERKKQIQLKSLSGCSSPTGAFSPVNGQQQSQGTNSQSSTGGGEKNQRQVNITKALEEIREKAKIYLKSFNLTTDKEGLKEIADDEALVFLQTLFSFHPSKGQVEVLDIKVGLSFNAPTFFVNQDAISVKKCICGLQNFYIDHCKLYAKAYIEQTQVKSMVSLLATIVKRYPFAAEEVNRQLLKTFPHQSSSFEHILIYQELALHVSESLLKQANKDLEVSQKNSIKGSVKTMFQKTAKKLEPLKSALAFEQQILGASSEKIAMLDADVKLRGRKGATFPSSHKVQTTAWIQPLEEFHKELSLRQLTEKEVKISLLLTSLLNYLDRRLTTFEKYQAAECNVGEYFVTPLMRAFENRIFKQSKSSFTQYIPLFIIAKGMQSKGVSREACKLFTEQMLSFLIIKALKGTGQEILITRMQAMNFLGSILSQKIVEVHEKTFMKCLHLMLDINAQNYKTNPIDQPNQKIFGHCFISNLALIFSAHHEVIKKADQSLYGRIMKLVFQKKFSSLEYASPFVLEQIIENSKEGLFDRVHFQQVSQKLKTLMDRQHDELKTTKVQVYNKIPRWMPYSTPIYFQSVKSLFEKVSTRTRGKSDQEETKEDATMNDSSGEESSNILHEPSNRLQRKRSTHNAYEVDKGEKTNLQLVGTGSISQAFRKNDKYTSATIINQNPSMFKNTQPGQQNLVVPKKPSDIGKMTPDGTFLQQSLTIESIVFNEEVQSVNSTDMITNISSDLAESPQQSQFMIEAMDLKSAIRREVKIGRQNITATLKEQNAINEKLASASAPPKMKDNNHTLHKVSEFKQPPVFKMPSVKPKADKQQFRKPLFKKK